MSVCLGSNSGSRAALCGQEACLCGVDVVVPLALHGACREGLALCDSQKSAAWMSGILVSVGLQLWSQVFVSSGSRGGIFIPGF